MADYRLSIEEMQCRFNRGKYWHRMQRGEFTEQLIRKTSNIKYPEVLARHPDAESVTMRYQDQNGDDIVEVHYYRLPDGSVIPGKRPDPKLLFEDGVMYHQEPEANRLSRLTRQAQDAAPLRWFRIFIKWLTCRDLGVVSPC